MQWVWEKYEVENRGCVCATARMSCLIASGRTMGGHEWCKVEKLFLLIDDYRIFICAFMVHFQKEKTTYIFKKYIIPSIDKTFNHLSISNLMTLTFTSNLDLWLGADLDLWLGADLDLWPGADLTVRKVDLMVVLTCVCWWNLMIILLKYPRVYDFSCGQ
jgi:hypothetical protein